MDNNIYIIETGRMRLLMRSDNRLNLPRKSGIRLVRLCGICACWWLQTYSRLRSSWQYRKIGRENYYPQPLFSSWNDFITSKIQKVLVGPTLLKILSMEPTGWNSNGRSKRQIGYGQFFVRIIWINVKLVVFIYVLIFADEIGWVLSIKVMKKMS